jgi:succinoglycan biosynthesis protein ExoW
MIAIIIPYYQREPGILRRALDSIRNQAGAPPFHIYIVDDSSPSPVEAELENLPPEFFRSVTMLRQPNAGPGAARNRAMDALPDNVSRIAFLDSDDAWEGDHLANLDAAFAAGADFYFTDHQRQDDAQRRFAQCAFEPDGAAIDANHPSCRWCDAELAFRAVVRRSPVATPTVAFRRRGFGDFRFNGAFRSAGEDTIFWLQLLTRQPKIVCNTDCEVDCGRGVSIFNHRSWGDARSFRTSLDQMRLQLYLRRNFALDSAQRRESLAQCRRLDLTFCGNLLACVRRRDWAAIRLGAAYLRHRPWALLRLPQVLWRAATGHFGAFAPPSVRR